MSELREQLQKTLGASYTLERELGGGGMSRVFVAEETSLGRKVVVKVLPHDLAAAVNLERFRREIQMAAKLQHPHIVPVLAAGVSDGLPYYTMPFIEGESLRAKLSRGGELPIHDAVKIIRDMLSALAYAHDHGVVHRDIKPDNILLTGGHAVVADFGVAKAISASTNPGASLTSLGVALGTPAYMSPEQAAADPTTDHRSDLYSVGAVAYEMLSGQQVFSSRSPQAMLAAHALEEPESLEKRRKSVPPLLSALIMRALEKHAADRPQSAAEMLAQLDAAVTPSAATTPYTGTMPARKVTASNRSAWMGIGAAALLLTLGSSSWYWYKHKQPGVATPLAVADSTTSLAVLPFENLGKPDDAYFADGMTEEISSRLGQLSGLRVIGRQSVRGYANSNKTISQIGKELGVGYVLTGSVRWDRSGAGKSRVRVSPALLRTSDGSQVWSEPYEDEVSGVFQIQSKVAQKVADALKIQLNRGEQQTLASRPTENVEAYDAYLRGKALAQASYGVGGGATFIRAAGLLQHSVDLDPRFVQAWAELGNAHLEAYWFKGDVTPRRLQLAKSAIDKALSLDQNSAAAHNALGYYYYHGKLDYARALDEFSIAQRLAPSDASATDRKALVERRQGKWTDALADSRRAVALEPRSSAFLANLASTLGWVRDFNAQDSVARRLIAMDPTSVNGYLFLAGAYLGKGDVQNALRMLREEKDRVPEDEAASSYIGVFTWPAFTDPVLDLAMHNAPPPTNRGDRSLFYSNKLTLAIYEKDVATQRLAADSVLAIAPSQMSGSFLDAENYATLALAYAVKGDRSRAIAMAQKAGDLMPLSRDAVRGSGMLVGKAFLHAYLGEADPAISSLEESLRIPSAISRATVKLDPWFDPIRKDPRFLKLVAGN